MNLDRMRKCLWHYFTSTSGNNYLHGILESPHKRILPYILFWLKYRSLPAGIEILFLLFYLYKTGKNRIFDNESVNNGFVINSVYFVTFLINNS